MKLSQYGLCILLMLPVAAHAWHWMDLWQTPDQQGSKLLQSGQPKEAAKVFKDDKWIGVSHYRSGNYDQAYKQFSHYQTSDGQYNAGNAAAFNEKYQEAITAYDKAISLNPNNTDAIHNRDIVKKLMQEQKQDPQQNQQQDNKQQKQNKQNSQNQQQSENSSSDKKEDQNKDKQSNSGSEQNKDKKDGQKDNQQNSKQDKQENNQNNNNDQSQQSGESKPTPATNQPQDASASPADSKQGQDENGKQLLRRLTDEPGGLLQQKFMRDYSRRHGGTDNSDQENNYDYRQN